MKIFWTIFNNHFKNFMINSWIQNQIFVRYFKSIMVSINELGHLHYKNILSFDVDDVLSLSHLFHESENKKLWMFFKPRFNGWNDSHSMFSQVFQNLLRNNIKPYLHPHNRSSHLLVIQLSKQSHHLLVYHWQRIWQSTKIMLNISHFTEIEPIYLSLQIHYDSSVTSVTNNEMFWVFGKIVNVINSCITCSKGFECTYTFRCF